VNAEQIQALAFVLLGEVEVIMMRRNCFDLDFFNIYMVRVNRFFWSILLSTTGSRVKAHKLSSSSATGMKVEKYSSRRNVRLRMCEVVLSPMGHRING
jgi:hypothetical protein